MKRKLSPLFPYIAATTQAVLYVHAFVVYLGLGWGWAIGLPLGVVISLSVAYGASKVSEVAEKRRGLARLGLVSLMILSPVIVAPSLYAALDPGVLAGVSWARWLLAITASLAPDGAILTAGAIAGRGMFAAPSADETHPSTHIAAPSTHKKRSPTGWPRKCDHCGEMLKLPQAVGAHMRQHHPDKCKHEVYSMEVTK